MPCYTVLGSVLIDMYFVYNRLTTVHNCARRRSNLNHKLADIDKIYNEPRCNEKTCVQKSLLQFGPLFTLTTAHIFATNVKMFRYATSGRL